MNIVIMGAPGSGKTTQASLLTSALGLPHIETGNIYRQIARQDSPLGRKVKSILAKGDLVDDQTTLAVIDRHLAEVKNGMIIDGFPRTLVQAQRELFPVDKVIYIRLSDQEATRRLLSRGRPGETDDVIAERLRLYHQDTQPILDYYHRQDKLLEIDGTGTIDQVHRLLLQSLNINPPLPQ